MNRYCKLVICFAARSNAVPFLFPTNFVGGKDSYKWYAHGQRRERLFIMRTYCFIRLTVDGICHYITSGAYYPRAALDFLDKDSKNISSIFRRYPDANICVDLMIYTAKEVIDLKVGDIGGFNAAGHFPILAGYDESGRALYHAHSESTYSRATFIADGSSSVTFMDRNGKLHTTQNFKVSVLRFDPSDRQSHRLSGGEGEGAMDATGPLHWRRLWPSYDPFIERNILSKEFIKFYVTTRSFFERCSQSAATPSRV
ncbi:hypothetical protein SCHPADRAFT_656888 [Schizopora paradoxa]|uniref:Uncharacterized protein n=1 Tax=Schizopora paradoxa TaxID=27342 RepID=A0A0H2R7B0_9AGAM|nr:hypothetical protein SCHPADRAFT_656888 [Schizopora paradoxa]